MIDQGVIDTFRQAFLGAGGPIGAGDEVIRASLEDALALFVKQVEGARGSALCDCVGVDSVPTNAKTGAVMDHHCDCRSVVTAAMLLGAYSKTVHAEQCGHGTSMDAFYQHGGGES